MVELAVRLVLSLGIVGLSATTGTPPLDWTWRIALFQAAYAFVAHSLETKDQRNAGISGLIAVIDAACIAILLGKAGAMEHYGFLVLTPCAYAGARYAANAAAMAPLYASFLFAGSALSEKPVSDKIILAQSAGVLAIGLLLNQARRIKVITEKVKVEVPVEVGVPPAQILELRENFRRMRDHAESLERKGRKDRLIASLSEASHGAGENLQQRLANKLRELCRVEGLSIYSAAMMADQLVVRGTSGNLPDAMSTMSFDISNAMTDSLIKKRVDTLIRSVRTEKDGHMRTATVVMRDRGRLIGTICLTDSNAERLQQGMETAEECSTILGTLIREDTESEKVAQRMKQAELLYTVSTVTTGSTTPTQLAARVVREAWDMLDVDHLSVHFLDEQGSIQVASAGATAHCEDLLRLPTGQGLEGWIESGCPEMTIFDTSEDDRVDRTVSLRKRIGSLFMIPIQYAEQAIGFLVAATHHNGGVDTPQIETLRTITNEMSQAIGRLESPVRGPSGLLTPKEFQEAISETDFGCFVYLEPIKRDALIEDFGAPALDIALQQYGRRVKQKLPRGGLMCRRAEGDFVVFLRNTTEGFARQWANDAVANASLIGVTTPDGRHKIPLALRAKVSEQVSSAAGVEVAS